MPIPADQREVWAGTTPVFTALIRDHDGTAIPLAALDTLTLTVWARPSNQTIRDGENVKNAGGVTVHATSGLVTWTLTPADTALTDPDPNVDSEQRVYRFDWAWTTGSTTYVGSSGQDFFRVLNPNARRQQE